MNLRILILTVSSLLPWTVNWASGERALTDGPPVLYRLIQGASLSVDQAVNGSGTPPGPWTLTGSFHLSHLVSPLDFDNYQVSDVRFTAATPDGATLPLFGSGSYSRGGRLQQSQNLVLDVTWQGAALSLASGSIGLDDQWPILALTLTGTQVIGTATNTYTLYLTAVPELRRWHYRLLGNATFTDDCPVCDFVTRPAPMKGSFDLVLVDQNPVRSRYHLFNLACQSALRTGESIQFVGEGSYEFGGEVAVQQTVVLGLECVTASTRQFKMFTNTTSSLGALWPLIGSDLVETNGTPSSTYELHLSAAPLNEIWFSTTQSMTPAPTPFGGLPQISPGDLISDSGSVVRRNTDLIQALAPKPPVKGVPMTSAVGLMPGSTIVFSLSQPLQSSTLGDLQAGDLVSASGKLIRLNQDFTAAFGIQPPVPDLGLDAIQFRDGGEILFSTKQDAFGEVGGPVNHGDLLSTAGHVLKSNAQLLKPFAPTAADTDFGLDAFFVWPSGEIWFSTEKSFDSQVFGAILDGDLLSDQGYIVFRNLDLVAAFAPMENSANFGLDALVIVNDFGPTPPQPTLDKVTTDLSSGDVTLSWQTSGQAVQVERTSDLALPFSPVSRIVLGTVWTDPGAGHLQPGAYYRLHQW